MNYNLLIFGAGQLGLLLVEESIKLKDYINKIYIYTDNEDNCCKYLNYDYIEIIVNSYNNSEKINQIGNICDFITYEFESFSLDVFSENNKKKNIPLYKYIKNYSR